MSTEDKLNELVEKSADVALRYLESGDALARAEAPALIEEILRWGLWSNVAGAVFCIAAFGAIWVLRAIISASLDLYNGEDGVSCLGVSYLFAGVFSIIPLGGAATSAFTAVKVLLAPRMYLLEQFGQML